MMIYRVLTIVVGVIIIAIFMVIWAWYRNRHNILSWWNHKIKSECDQQDIMSLNGIPSYCDAMDCSNKTATELTQLIRINHDDILNEVMAIVDKGLISDFKSINQMLEFSEDPWIMNENKWSPIWVKFMGEWTGASDQFPTLKNISALFPEIGTLYVSIFYPGETLINQQGPSRIYHRYHYGLKIPDGDIGLKINGFDVKWKEKEGFIWDDTLTHSAWNHNLEPRLVIFAKIMRNFSTINTIGSKLIYLISQKANSMNAVKSVLRYEDMIMR